jgi:hypothetical protein
LKKEDSEVATNCSRLKLIASDGKMRITDVADAERSELSQKVGKLKLEFSDGKNILGHCFMKRQLALSNL